MARSSYIYVAARKMSNEPVSAAFTVKRELVEWLRTRTPQQLTKMRVVTVVDGEPKQQEPADLVLLNAKD
jgi:hypothetical protein